jgi:hypothetical protein
MRNDEMRNSTMRRLRERERLSVAEARRRVEDVDVRRCGWEARCERMYPVQLQGQELDTKTATRWKSRANRPNVSRGDEEEAAASAAEAKGRGPAAAAKRG